MHVSADALGNPSQLALLKTAIFLFVVPQPFFQEPVPEQHPCCPSSRRVDDETSLQEIEHVVHALNVSFGLGWSRIAAWGIVKRGVEGQDHLAEGFGRVERDRVQVCSKGAV